MQPTEAYFSLKDTHTPKMNGWKNSFQTNSKKNNNNKKQGQLYLITQNRL